MVTTGIEYSENQTCSLQAGSGDTGAAAPASGVFKIHLQQQQALVEAALDIESKATKSAKPRKSK